MRRALLLFLLALLPFQFVWGAAANYCQHEQGSDVRHFGHHAHKHAGKLLKTSAELTAEKKTVVGDDDPDCASCHLSCVSPLMQTLVLVGCAVADLPHTLPDSDRPPHISSTIDRPNWTLAA